MQGSLRVISLMFAPRDPHLTFPHLSLHKINPFLAPPRLTSLTSAQSTTDKIQYTRHSPHWHNTSNTILPYTKCFLCITLPQKTELFTKMFVIPISLDWTFCMVQVEEGYVLVNFSKSVYIVCSVATDTKDYKIPIKNIFWSATDRPATIYDWVVTCCSKSIFKLLTHFVIFSRE